MTKEELREKANDLPLLPGVYLMMDKTGKVIYVGKAKKLKNRVSQYFQDTASHNEKTRAMVSQVDHFDTIFVSSEFEALILENSLIKRHQPRYNILLKDDKGYPFIRLDTGASYPRFTLAGKAEEDGARYFGPFGGRRETRLAIEAVCGALKLPICSRQFPRDIGRERPCLNHHIGRCDGFCLPGGPDQAEYRRRIRQAERIFSGHYRQLTAELQTEMEDAAEELNFEKAAALRDRIRAISVLGKQQQVIAGVCADTDVWGVYVGQVRSGCAVLHIEDGNLLGREVEVFPTAADEALPAVLAAVLQQYYLERGALPSEILLPEPVEDMETLAALLTGRAVSKRNFVAIAGDCVVAVMAVRDAGRKRRMLRFWRPAWICFLRLRSNKLSACCVSSNGSWRCKCKGRQPSPLRKMSCPLLYLQLCPGVNRRQRPIPYSRIHMHRSSRSINVVRVTVAGPSACVRWR